MLTLGEGRWNRRGHCHYKTVSEDTSGWACTALHCIALHWIAIILVYHNDILTVWPDICCINVSQTLPLSTEAQPGPASSQLQ